MVTTRETSLTVHRGPEDGRTIVLGERPIVLGRGLDNDVVIDEPAVSRRHALIMKTPYGFVVRDLNSVNGTYVDDRKIPAVGHLLMSGARVRLAASEVTLVFRQEALSTVLMETDEPASNQLIASLASSLPNGGL